MKRAMIIQQEYSQIGTIEDLTSIFEAIASIHIAQIKDKVVSSTAFFNELWSIYHQLRISEADRIMVRPPATIQRPVVMIVTSEGGLIGDIDDKIVDVMAATDLTGVDIVVVGSHGVTLLDRRGIKPTAQIPMPDVEKGVELTDLARFLGQYQSATVYYQTYLSLARQDVAKLDLFSAMSSMGKEIKEEGGEIISSQDYIFEPSLTDITAYMESVMLQIAVGQVLLESKLAQYASRFSAMSAAKNKAKDMKDELRLDLSRSKRGEADERIREAVSARRALR